MQNQLEKLKNSIRIEYTKDFELNLMETLGFIPVDKRLEDFYIILNKKNISSKSDIEKLIKEKYADFSPKFIPVESNDFTEILTAIKNNTSSQTAVTETKELSAEEMLVGIGWLTKEQLQECQNIAKQKLVPLDTIFNEKEYLSYEKIVSYILNDKKFC